eukprot:GHVO01009897.1.p1 GENE.GHVO01009897.1~~GHVO01009897.1.p1  ORF type:complete len:145 (+),score=25.61 GHVO01009897.1:544-978(+)
MANMKLVTIDTEKLSVPESNYSTEVTLPTKSFQTVVRDLSVLGDTVKIRVTEDSVQFDADGDAGKVENVLHKGDERGWKTLRAKGAIEQEFAVRYLNFFTKGCPLGEVVTLGMSVGVPLRVRFPIGGESALSFYLAPKLDDGNE